MADVYRKLNLKDNVIKTYREAIRVFPENAGLYWGLASALSSTEQYEEAIELLKKAYKLDAKTYFLSILGSLYKKAGNLTLALEFVNQAISQNSTPQDYKLKAEILLMQCHIDEAKNAYQEITRVCQKCAWGYSVLGEFLVNQKDKKGALKQYQILKTLDLKMANELLRKIQAR